MVRCDQKIPWIINLELTNACNLACVFCDHKILKKKMLLEEMDEWLLKKILTDIRTGQAVNGRVYELGLVGLGEPTLDRNLRKHLVIVNEYADLFERISLNSNLVSLTPKIAERLLDSEINVYTFSVNASNRKVYRKMMSRDKFTQVIKNLRDFLTLYTERRSAAIVEVQVLDSPENDLAELKSEVPESADVQVIFFTRKVYSKPILQKGQKLLRIHDPGLPERYPCWDIYTRAYIDVQGNFYPCTIGNDCYRETSKLCLGSVHDNTVLALFNNMTIRRSRQRSERGDLPFPECEICNVWSLTPNNFWWDSESRTWKLKKKQIRAYGLKE